MLLLEIKNYIRDLIAAERVLRSDYKNAVVKNKLDQQLMRDALVYSTGKEQAYQNILSALEMAQKKYGAVELSDKLNAETL